MSDINVFTFSGNLGRDAETRFTQQGTAVMGFSVANTTGWGDKKKTNWVKCAVFGKRAESDKLKDALTKGSKVTVSGELSLNEYQGKDGPKSELQVIVRDMALHGGGQQKEQPAQQTEPQDDGFSDDIPW